MFSISLRKAWHSATLPREFELFTSTSFAAVENQKTLSSAEFEEQYFTASGGKPWVNLGNTVLHCGLYYSGSVIEQVLAGNRPILEIDASTKMPIDIKLPETRGESVPFLDGPYKGLRVKYPHLDSVIFKGSEASPAYFPVCIRGGRILRVIITESYQGHLLYFEDCWIGSLQIEKRETNPNTYLLLNRCYVGDLNMGANGCAEFSMKEVGIKRLTCPSSSMPSPVAHAFTIDDRSALHHSPNHASESDVVNYRNLLGHIKNRASPNTQQLLNATILRLERKDDSQPVKFISFCYDIFSAYND